MRASQDVMRQREEEMRGLVASGYTVREAGRVLGLTRHQAEHLAKTRNIQAFQGAISEAKSDAAIKGNQLRWGG